MKKRIARILCLLCMAAVLFGCARVPADDPVMDLPATEPTEPPTEPATTEPATEPPTEPATTEPPTEPAPTLPEGTPLTEEEIAWFNAHFFTAEWAETGDSASSKFFKIVNIRNQFLFQEYDSPENIDLKILFFQGFSLSEFPTTAEKVAVHEMLGMEWSPEPGCAIDLFRVPRENMEAVFLENTGLTIAQTNQIGMDGQDYYYLEKYDAYYHSLDAFAYDCFIVSDGVRQEDGTVVLRYYRPRSEQQAEGIVTLQPQGDSYWFVSNVHME